MVNKLALSYYGFPNTILLLQFASSAAFAWAGGRAGLWELDPLELGKAQASVPVVLCFFAAIFTNLNALKRVNVDTMIVFRTCMPLAVAAGQWLFMGYELPSARSWASMGMVVLTTMAVFATDSPITTAGEACICRGGGRPGVAVACSWSQVGALSWTSFVQLLPLALALTVCRRCVGGHMVCHHLL